MNDEFNSKNDDEVVDSIPQGARPVGEENPLNNLEYGGAENRNFYNGRTKIIIEHGPASIVTKIAFILSLLSVIFCLFPRFAFIAAFLGAGIALLSIAYRLNGRVIAVFAVGLSILGAILAAMSSVLWTIWYAILGLF